MAKTCKLHTTCFMKMAARQPLQKPKSAVHNQSFIFKRVSLCLSPRSMLTDINPSGRSEPDLLPSPTKRAFWKYYSSGRFRFLIARPSAYFRYWYPGQDPFPYSAVARFQPPTSEYYPIYSPQKSI